MFASHIQRALAKSAFNHEQEFVVTAAVLPMEITPDCFRQSVYPTEEATNIPRAI